MPSYIVKCCCGSRGVPMPERVQLSRKKGWRMPPNTVKVDRSTVFGNPAMCWTHGCKNHPCKCHPDFYEGEDYCCLETFREYVSSGLENRPSRTGSLRIALEAAAGYYRRAELVARIPELRGKNLACWCALDRPCHADILLELANSGGFRKHPAGRATPVMQPSDSGRYTSGTSEHHESGGTDHRKDLS